MKTPESRAALIAQAAAIINAEFSRLNLAPLNSEQVDALGDESQAFEMLDDFEARLGCSDSEIGEARALLVDVFALNEKEPEPMNEQPAVAPVSVLNINADLLRSWEACSDGFKWFLHTFPQGGEFGAVYDELRKQRRFSDSTWLVGRVFENALNEPGAVGKIVVSLGADGAAIDAEVKAKGDTGTTSAVDEACLAASGNYSRLAASGYASSLAASGNASSLAASGYASSLAASGYARSLAASGNASSLAASGNASSLAASGFASSLAASGNASSLAASGNDSRLAA